MAKIIRNAGSAPIYRETENLLLYCVEVAERTPKSAGIRQISIRLVDTLVDALTNIGLALNESDLSSKLEIIDSFYIQMRTVKTCIDTLKEWSGRNRNVRIISNRQMPQLANAMNTIANQTTTWRSKVWSSINPS